MHDKHGKPLKVGDRVRVEFVVTELHEGGGDFCNVRIETLEGLPGNGLKSSISAINTKQLEKIDE
jgi:hypothetical protein